MDTASFIQAKLSGGGLLVISETTATGSVNLSSSIQTLLLEHVSALPPTEVAGDCVVVHVEINIDNKEQFIIALAKLRDTFGKPVFVISTTSEHMNSSDFLALGYQKVDELNDGHEVYYFSLHNYKRTPDWLNSKFWANPHMWNKSRW